jgi:molecular chaperone DnaK
VDIINEPTAATLAYAWTKGELGRLDAPNNTKTILVYDLGGGTFDVTVVRYSPTEFTVVATDGDTMLGGLDWSSRVLDYVCEKFVARHGLDPREDARTRFALLRECESAKRELSHWIKTRIDVTYRGQTLPVELTRTEFEKLTLDLLQRTRDTTEFVLDSNHIARDEISEVLLVGGSTSMPAVSEMLEKLIGKRPSKVLNPQLAVAQGAAIHAAILESKATDAHGRASAALLKRLRAVTTTDVNSHSLGVEIVDPKRPDVKWNHIMIPRNSRLPCGTKKQFVTTVETPQSIVIRLLQGEAREVSACTYIGDVRISQLPKALPAGSPVEVVYSYDHRGHITVSARELTGGGSAAVEIAWGSALDSHALDTLRELVRQYHIE